MHCGKSNELLISNGGMGQAGGLGLQSHMWTTDVAQKRTLKFNVGFQKSASQGRDNISDHCLRKSTWISAALLRRTPLTVNAVCPFLVPHMTFTQAVTRFQVEKAGVYLSGGACCCFLLCSGFACSFLKQKFRRREARCKVCGED